MKELNQEKSNAEILLCSGQSVEDMSLFRCCIDISSGGELKGYSLLNRTNCNRKKTVYVNDSVYQNNKMNSPSLFRI